MKNTRQFNFGKWFGLFGVATTIAILIWFAFSDGGLSSLISQLARTDARWLAVALLISVAYWFFEALVLQLLTRSVCKTFKFTDSMHTGLVGLFYNAVTPFSSGGQPMQLYVMSKQGLDLGAAGSILITKSIIYQTCLTAIAVFSIIFGADYFHAQVPYFSAFVAAGLAVNLAAVLAMYALSGSDALTKKISRAIVLALDKIKLIRHPDKILQKVHLQISIFHESSGRFGKNAPIKLLSYALTITQFLAYYSMPYCIYKSFGLSGASILLMLCAQSIITMITSFIPIPGLSGAAEGSFYLFFSLFFSAAAIVPAILVWRFLTYYLSVISGGVMWALSLRQPQSGA
jgi:uncharacterized protein (TIRG00374 family)